MVFGASAVRPRLVAEAKPLTVLFAKKCEAGGLIAAAPLNLYRSHRAWARVANLVGKLVLDELEGDLDNVLILLSRVLNVLLVFVGVPLDGDLVGYGLKLQEYV